MRNLLAVTIGVLTFMVIFSLNLNLAPGLSMKNLFIYLPGIALLFQYFVWGQRPRADLPFMQRCFAALMGYALLTIVIVGNFAGYRDYTIPGTLVILKGMFFDWWVLYSVFFYGARTVDDAKWLIKVMLVGVSIANVATLAAFAGLISLGGTDVVVDTGIGDENRVMGVFGHANETGTLIAYFMPAYIVVVESASGIRKWLWIGCLMASVSVLILNASRGASVGLIIGALWAAVLCKKYLSLERTVKWITSTVAVVVPVVLVLGLKYWDQMLARFSTSGAHGDVSDLTSGRNDIWWSGISRMLESPWSFVTGMGYNSWLSTTTSGFIEHNEYLAFYYELGLIGLIAFITILAKSVTTALSAAAVADQKTRPYMLACVFSVLILAVGVMFGNLIMPWIFIWPYLGLMLRFACLILAENRSAAAARLQQAAPPSPPRLARSPATDSPVRLPRRPTAGGRQVGR